jgi:hypothetical protein
MSGTAEPTRHAPPPDVALRLFRERFLNRADRLAFKPPWDAAACPFDPCGDLDAILRAHLCGPAASPPVRLKWLSEGKGKSDLTEPGHWRVGTYAPAPDGTTLWLCLDFDGTGGHAAPLADPLAVALTAFFLARSLGLACYLEKSRSGTGWHLWIFFAIRVPASLARRLGFLLAPRDAPLADGGVADPERGRGIEIFPKADRLKKGRGVGHQVWLPWSHSAEPGGGEFYRPGPQGGLTPFAPSRLDVVTVAAAEEAIRRLKSDAARPDRDRPPNGEYRGWRAEALARLPLEAVYGDVLTGKAQGAGWLEARDPNSPTGDRNPSAGVSTGEGGYERGKFKSFIDGRCISVFDFLVERGRASDFRQAQRIVADLTGIPLPCGRGPRVKPGPGPRPSADGGNHRPPEGGPEAGATTLDAFANYFVVPADEGKKVVKVGRAAATLAEELRKFTGDWPRRVGANLFVEVEGHRILWLDGPDALFAWLGRKLPAGEQNRVLWAEGHDKVSPRQFSAFLQQTATDYDAVEVFPHWPPLPRTFYSHPPLKGGDGRALRELCKQFHPATPIDGDLVLSYFLTLVWGGPPGKRPAFVVTGEANDPLAGRGVGKSTLAMVGANVVGGQVDADPQKSIGDLATRLLSPDAFDKRVVLLDNLKTLHFSWGDLEKMVTNDVVSGKQLYVGEGRRPNTLTWVVTLNGASLSRDMAQRSAIIRMGRPHYASGWNDRVAELVSTRRWEILGDLVAVLKGEAPALAQYSRWATWERDVLARVGEPSDSQKVVQERQDEVDDDAQEEDLIREAFATKLRGCGHVPEAAAVWLSAAEVTEIVNLATGEKRPTNKATAHLGTLAVAELRRSNRSFGRGWLWTGKKAPQGARPVKLNHDPIDPDGGDSG